MSEPAPALPVAIECELTETDYLALQQHVLKRSLRLLSILLVGPGVVVVAKWFDEAHLPLIERLYSVLVQAVFQTIFVLFVIIILKVLLRLVRRRFGGPIGKHVFEITPDTIKESNEWGIMRTSSGGNQVY